MRVRQWVVAAAALVVLGSCAWAADKRPSATSADEVVVLVALGLDDPVRQAAKAFEQARPGVEVDLDVAHIPELLIALDQGLPADLLVAPDDARIRRVIDAGKAVGTPRELARDHLAIVVPKGNPGDVEDVADLARPGTTVGICQPQLPCGPLAVRVLERAGVWEPTRIDGGGPGIVAKVAQGELDAGIVLATIARGSTEVTSVAIPAEHNEAMTLSAVVLAGAAHPGPARAFLDFLTSEAGSAVFVRHGYLRP